MKCDKHRRKVNNTRENCIKCTLPFKDLMSERYYNFFCNKLLIIQEGHIKLIKSDSRHLCYKIYIFQINAVPSLIYQ